MYGYDDDQLLNDPVSSNIFPSALPLLVFLSNRLIQLFTFGLGMDVKKRKRSD